MLTMSKKQTKHLDPRAAKFEKPGFALGLHNYKLMLIGLGIIVLGFILMSGGKTPDPTVFDGDAIYNFRRLTLAPAVVIFGFAFQVYAIMKKPEKKIA